MYICKNLKNQFTKQRLLSLLLVINIVVSCLVICFSYGLYHNYISLIRKGEEEKTKYLSVLVDETNCYNPDDAKDLKNFAVGSLKPKQLIELIRSFPESVMDNIEGISFAYIVKSPLFFDDSDLYYSDKPSPLYDENAEPCYIYMHCSFTLENDLLVNLLCDRSGRRSTIFTSEQFNSGEKIIALSEECFSDYTPGYAIGDLRACACKLPEGTESVIVGGERFKIVVGLDNFYADIPVASIPDSAQVLYRSYGWPVSEHQREGFAISFKGPVTHLQRDEISECIKNVLGDEFYLEDVRFVDVTDLAYYKSIILISVLIAAISSINMAILYSYMLEKRSREIAVFRVCGMSKGKAVFSYLLESLILNAPLFIITEIAFHKLLIPQLVRFFPKIRLAYSTKLYVAIFFIYIAVLTAIMLTMFIFKISKHSISEVHRAPRAATKVGIMKVFEVLQLATVLIMMITVISAIVSRYNMFENFEPFLSRRGYMIKFTDMATYPEAFDEITGEAESITNGFTNIYEDTAIGGSYSGGIEHGMITYSGEFIEAYKPPMEDGVWLDEIDETFESTGYIPAVVTDSGNEIGDIIESTIVMEYDENGAPVRTAKAKYKIVGIVSEKASLASYYVDKAFAGDYTDLFETFRRRYEGKMFLLTRTSDVNACYGSYGALYGVQFVFCDDMTDEEYEKMGNDLAKLVNEFTTLSRAYDKSLSYVYEQLYTLLPIAVCIFILTVISTVSINAIYTKRQLRNYAIFYICGARWRSCALKSLKNSAITCGIAAALTALVLLIGKLTFWSETVITFGWEHLAVCAGVIILYLALSMIMPLSIIGSAEPKDVLSDE